MRKMILLFLIMASSTVNAQKSYNYENENYDFLGYFNDKLVYMNWNDRTKLYYPVLDNNIVKGFTLSNLTGEKSLWYLNDSIKINHSLKEKTTSINYRGESRKILDGIRLKNKSHVATYSREREIIILTYSVATTSMFALYDLSSDTTLFLPTIGSWPTFSNDYLYFSADHICEWYSSTPEDVYRVKSGDWNNPELVLTNVVSGSWFVIPETNILYARIKLKEKGKGILYNTDTKSYAIIDELYCNRVIKYEDNFYYEIRPSNKPISYKPVELPEEYPHKDIRILCDDKDRIIVNLSNKEKPFITTFINDELLYKTDTSELEKLTKDELRILRNAFYARHGYQFNSKDLQDFFGQFEWYHKMVERNKYLEITNEDVIITKEDKARAELIKEIENKK